MKDLTPKKVVSAIASACLIGYAFIRLNGLIDYYINGNPIVGFLEKEHESKTCFYLEQRDLDNRVYFCVEKESNRVCEDFFSGEFSKCSYPL